MYNFPYCAHRVETMNQCTSPISTPLKNGKLWPALRAWITSLLTVRCTNIGSRDRWFPGRTMILDLLFLYFLFLESFGCFFFRHTYSSIFVNFTDPNKLQLSFLELSSIQFFKFSLSVKSTLLILFSSRCNPKDC